MSEKEKKLVLTGGISFNDFKDTKPSNLVSKNTSNDMKGFTPIKDLFSDDKGKLQDNDTKNIQRNLDLINRLEYKNYNTTFSSETIKRTQEFIEREEGLRLKAYKDTGGVWTIGYGHTKNVKPDDKITKEEAEKFFIKDIQEHITPLKNVKIPLSENEKIALVSFIYNVGQNAFLKSTLLKKLNNNDKKGAAEEFNKWIYDNGKIQNGLIKRRTNEKNLFLKKD